MKYATMVLGLAILLGGSSAFGEGVDINGGTSWNGWTHRGNSLDVGIWGTGSIARSYELYTTTFTFNNNTFDPSSGGTQVNANNTPTGFAAGTFSTGAFANGHTILGIGLDLNGSAKAAGGLTFVSFGLHGGEWKAASSLGASDGVVDNESVNAYAGDFAVMMQGANGPSNLGVTTTNGTAHGGTGALSNLPGGYGSGVSYDYAFRQFRNGDAGGSIQMFFDLTAMQDLYGGGSSYIEKGWDPSAAHIGTIGSNFEISMYNSDPSYGNANQVTFSVPEPATMGLLALGGLALLRRKRKA